MTRTVVFIRKWIASETSIVISDRILKLSFVEKKKNSLFTFNIHT